MDLLDKVQGDVDKCGDKVGTMGFEWKDKELQGCGGGGGVWSGRTDLHVISLEVILKAMGFDEIT